MSDTTSALMSDDVADSIELGTYGVDLFPSELSDQEASWPESSDREATWPNVNDALLDLLNCEDDWDGQGAAAPARELVLACFDLMRRLRNNQSQVPNALRANPDGSISIEWQFGEILLEMELSEHGGCVITSGPLGTKISTF